MDILNFYRNFIPEKIRSPFFKWRQQLKKWPQLLQYYSANLLDPSVQTMASRLESLRGSYNRQRCFIMGNGPSLNKMDLNYLENEYVWGSNRCYLLFDRIKWRPKFYVAVDIRVVPDNAKEINQLSKKLPDSFFFYPISFRYNRTLRSNKNVYWYKEITLNENDLPYSMFALNPSEYVYSVTTVTIAALQLAVFLGFNPIYLIGCDTSYTIPKTVQYENGNSNLITSTTDDPNHFDSDYFGKGKKWHDPHVDRMIFHYEQVKKVCDERNIQVFNATVGGNLEVYPRVNYSDLF